MSERKIRVALADDQRLLREGLRVILEAAPDMLMVRGKGDRIDIVFATVGYLQEALLRAVGGVLTVEDVIVQKLIGWRPRDRDDIASILEAGHRLDEDYISRWASLWEVDDRWAEARRRSG